MTYLQLFAVLGGIVLAVGITGSWRCHRKLRRLHPRNLSGIEDTLRVRTAYHLLIASVVLPALSAGILEVTSIGGLPMPWNQRIH